MWWYFHDDKEPTEDATRRFIEHLGGGENNKHIENYKVLPEDLEVPSDAWTFDDQGHAVFKDLVWDVPPEKVELAKEHYASRTPSKYRIHGGRWDFEETATGFKLKHTRDALVVSKKFY